jgi:hypothetical protein
LPPPRRNNCATPAEPDQNAVSVDESPVKRFVDGSVWLLRWIPVDSVGTNTPLAAATSSALMAGFRRSAARSALPSSASRTASSRVSRIVAAAGVAV